MTLKLNDDDLLRRFLLGSVSPEERDLVEERFMTDEDFFDALCALEVEMGLEHVRGRMPAPERELFEAAMLAVPARRRQVEEIGRFAAVLAEVAGSTAAATAPIVVVPPARDTGWRAFLAVARAPALLPRLALAGAVVAAVGAGAVLMRSPGDSLPASNSATTPGRAPADEARPQPVVATLVLVPGATRAELRQANLFARPVDADEIELVVTVPSVAATRVGAILRPVGGAPLPLTTEPAATRAEGGIVVRVRASASALPRGDYLLSLTREVGARPETFVSRFFTIDE